MERADDASYRQGRGRRRGRHRRAERGELSRHDRAGPGGQQHAAQTAGELADKAGVELAEDPDSATAENRRSGLGALMGYVTGLGVGAAYGLLRSRVGPVSRPVAALGLTTAATVASAGPMTLLGITDPRQWDAKSWVMDLGPHLAYGVVTAVVHDELLSR